MPRMAGSKRERPPTQRRNREAEVVEAAIDVFWRKGYSAATIQDVADHVGVLKGSLYHYISSKEDLLFTIFDESHRQAQEIAASVRAADGPAIEQLRTYFERYVRWYLDNVERVSLYLNEWRFLTGERYDTVVEQRRVNERFVRGLVEAAQAEGDVYPDVDAKYACFYILGAVNGIPTWYRRRGRQSPAQIARAYADMVVGTLRGTEPRSAPRRRAPAGTV